MIGAIASIAILIGFAVLGDQVKDALKESEHELDTAADAVGIGLFEIVCVNTQHLYTYSVVHHPVHCVHHLCLLHHHRLPPHPRCTDCKHS